MGWHTGPPSWSEMERVLNGKPRRAGSWPIDQQLGDGGDSPAWSRKREQYEPADVQRPTSPVPYAELHAHSAYSFLDGASTPEELVEEAVRLDLRAIALTDHDGLYGVVRFAEAARELDMATVFGAELSLGGGDRTRDPDPPGPHLLVLARGPEGYRRLSRELARAHLAGGEKGVLRYDYDALTEAAGGHWHILTGCRKGHVRQALSTGGPEAAAAALADLVDRFGRDRVSVELTHHGHPCDDERNAVLADLAPRFGLSVVATTAAHFAEPSRGRLAMAMGAIRARHSLDEAAGYLAPLGGSHLRSGAEMARLFADRPEVVTAAAELGEQCAFELALIAPQLPPFDVPEGHTENSWLRHLTMEGASRRYGPPHRAPRAYAQIEHELRIIEQLDFPGYFLVVHDITRFGKENGILCQGRGSAANSAVCYALGVTNVDPIANDLLFERFLSPARDGPPDIDIDIESDLREQVIQYVYNRYGRDYAAQVANVITYRGRSAVRDMARALGYSQGQQDAWSKQLGQWGDLTEAPHTDDIPEQVIELAKQVANLPRHMGIHSGGMVICDRPIADVCPVEWARMENRSVLQWDKDDCAAIGLVKFDLLGLGMLSALHYCIDLVREHKGIEVDLAQLDLSEPAVYEMLQKADSVGVFQVESRAQMATLPRLKPRVFYDLVVEVALIRPGPIQGGSVHPYIKRRNGEEPVTYDHPSMEPALHKTLGVPLFQEQLMQLAVDCAGFTPAEADQLRRAMGSKRSTERMRRLRGRFYDGMRQRHGITGEVADRIYEKLEAFANFGFPESHSLSFASLVFYSSWFKLHHPAAFCAALLRAQPMGFYSPQTLVADARRHGVKVHGPDVNASLAHPTLENKGTEVRMGLGSVRHIGDDLAERIVEERKANGPFASLLDLTQRVQLTVPQTEALATAGALGCFGITRREGLWAAGAAATQRPDRLPGVGSSSHIPALPGMSELELAAADVWATGVSPDSYPTQFLREDLDALGVIPANRLLDLPDGSRVLIAGAVTHRQRPATAQGVTFLNLEDETGMVNVICSRGVWARHRKLAQTAPALLIRGQLQNATGAVTVVAERLGKLSLAVGSKSRDFR
ncbi:error-prone DNA polymerase [Mycolicibacterium phlei]|uniref:Error-prone DNA polymerase n=2 Tax=Mycolicibacterium phlei TaxID=1771 RepID=A0A5N5V467_MYCPH|nr:error-prone DNA polymerase [Mycolicibacterium phlei]KAB7756665.1 DNA polymerase [Mycolicibacterium phlei DSM 43239 = CCUG 21000]KXW63552.1 DNA polymerase [Mycolicibacterium phlei DSM 43239 = CCUG 21000]KXW66407.1 DNA polymerase [Mycolicibacterium phlei DSM 43072]KXW73933.1 DNA polymerase [Mycolicibacterium phlei DSM 43070]KXW76156.1 DNA polymerase [Mycolicibacterium phlei DSM 43071]